MVPGAENISEFFWNIMYLGGGAPLFVSSSLVAIMVFNNTLDHEDLPRSMQWLPGANKRGYIEEWAVYTLVILPLVSGWLSWMYIGNKSGLFVAVYNIIH
jgi:hypothetical protein